MASGAIDYFPDALIAVAQISFIGNEKHNKGQALHWARGKSNDEADALMRHFLQRGLIDEEDGIRHSAKVAWRALAMLQKEIEAEQAVVGSVRPPILPACKWTLCGNSSQLSSPYCETHQPSLPLDPTTYGPGMDDTVPFPVILKDEDIPF